MRYIYLRLEEILKEKSISKNRICYDLNLQRGNFNRYCRNDFQRLDCALLVKLCEYLNCSLFDLLEMREKDDK